MTTASKFDATMRAVLAWVDAGLWGIVVAIFIVCLMGISPILLPGLLIHRVVEGKWK
jgi:hypothetical protein